MARRREFRNDGDRIGHVNTFIHLLSFLVMAKSKRSDASKPETAAALDRLRKKVVMNPAKVEVPRLTSLGELQAVCTDSLRTQSFGVEGVVASFSNKTVVNRSPCILWYSATCEICTFADFDTGRLVFSHWT